MCVPSWNDDVGKMNFWCVTKTNDAFLKTKKMREWDRAREERTIKHFIVWISMSPIVLEIYLFFILGWKTAVASILK